VVFYRNLAKAAYPHPVVIRTLDLGGDKIPRQVHYFVEEKNPFLGLRAIRFCLENKEIFMTQLRAILRASASGSVKILYPMVTSVQELVKANGLLAQCKQELEEKTIAFDPTIQVGAMLETPSAVLIMDLLAPHCDFFSLGTNDLVQYLLAVDRTNERISQLYECAHPAVLRMLRQVGQCGKQFPQPICVCGEMANDPMMVALMMALGFRSFCVHADRLAELRYLIQNCSLAELQVLMQKCLKYKEAKQSTALLKKFYLKKLNEFA
jgi:phosphotransferase system enzyme I (PtsI)